ncbi:MAG: hypothetical protein R2932_21155 [Caldilineaceae bacterium]
MSTPSTPPTISPFPMVALRSHFRMESNLFLEELLCNQRNPAPALNPICRPFSTPTHHLFLAQAMEMPAIVFRQVYNPAHAQSSCSALQIGGSRTPQQPQPTSATASTSARAGEPRLTKSAFSTTPWPPYLFRFLFTGFDDPVHRAGNAPKSIGG